MDPLTIGVVAAPIIGGIIGNLAGGSDRNAANNAYNQAISELMAIGMPPNLAKEVVLKEFQSAGKLTPEMEQEVNLGPSKVEGITEDPSTREAQVQALQLLQQSGRGISPQDRLKFNEMRQQVQRDAEAKRQQILQEYKQRGMGGSGAELAAQLSQAQAGANQSSMEGDRIAAASAENALNAIRESGNLGGQIRGQDFDVARTKASAADEFAKFNAQNQASRQARNIGSRNDAQSANLANAQAIMNQNTAQANQERLRQNEAQRTYWQDQAQRAQMRAGAYNQQGSQADARAGRTANMWAGAGQAIGSGLDSYANRREQRASTAAITANTAARMAGPQVAGNVNGAPINSSYEYPEYGQYGKKY